VTSDLDPPTRVFISDSNRLLIGVLADALTEAGITIVGSATRCREVLDWLEAHPDGADVLITNILKDGEQLGGITLTREVRTRYPRLRVIILSAYDEPAIIEAALAAGAENAMKKGVGLDELLAAIQHRAGEPRQIA
jgi:DNA-binding NarL/FixJ family response regulator